MFKDRDDEIALKEKSVNTEGEYIRSKEASQIERSWKEKPEKINSGSNFTEENRYSRDQILECEKSQHYDDSCLVLNQVDVKTSGLKISDVFHGSSFNNDCLKNKDIDLEKKAVDIMDGAVKKKKIINRTSIIPIIPKGDSKTYVKHKKELNNNQNKAIPILESFSGKAMARPNLISLYKPISLPNNSKQLLSPFVGSKDLIGMENKYIQPYAKRGLNLVKEGTEQVNYHSYQSRKTDINKIHTLFDNSFSSRTSNCKNSFICIF